MFTLITFYLENSSLSLFVVSAGWKTSDIYQNNKTQKLYEIFNTEWKYQLVCLRGCDFGTYHWQFALFQLLPAPVEVAHVTASHNPMERVLQHVPILIIKHSPIEHMGIGAASQQQVQQCLMGNREMGRKLAQGDTVTSTE